MFLNFFFTRLLPVTFSFYLLFTGCSSTKEISNSKINSEIKIDGEASEWEERLTFLEENNTGIAITNNENELNICLAVTDEMQVMQMLRRGFIVWVTSADGTKKLGYKFPINTAFMENEPGMEERQVTERGDHEKMIGKLIEKQKEIQIVSEDNFPLTLLPVSNDEGINAAIGFHNSRFIYELKLPLTEQKKNRFTVAAKAGEKIKLHFETLEPVMKRMQRFPGGEEGPGGGSGRRGNGGGPMGGRKPEMMRREISEPLDFEVTVTLQ